MDHQDDKLPKHSKKAIEVEAYSYALKGDQMFKRGRDTKLRLCVYETNYFSVLTHAHSRTGGGHFLGHTTDHLILWSELWWPTRFGNANEYVKRCDQCQRKKPPILGDEMPLRPIMATRVFAKWGIDFVGPRKPHARHTHTEYIIVPIDYLTKWTEAKATMKNDAQTTTKFLYEQARYGLLIDSCELSRCSFHQ